MGAMSVLAGTSVRRNAARAAVCTLLAASAVPALSSVASADTGNAGASAAQAQDVTICHATNSAQNPYISVTVDPNAAGPNGLSDHLGHTGPVFTSGMKSGDNWGDIIPPTNGQSLNWPAGQAIFDNGCALPASTPSAGTPDLGIQKTGTASGKPGDPVTYTLTVTNNGTAATGTTTVTDTLPASLKPGTMTGPSMAWSCTTSQTPTCSTSSAVPANASLTFTVTTSIASGASAGKATDSGSVANAADTNPANDTATFDTTITTQQPTNPSASAAASCSVLSAELTPSNAASGTTFTVVHNGITDSVTTTGAKHVSYPSAAGATITVSAGGTQLATATAPASCTVTPPVVTPPVVTPPVVTPPAVAAPTATAHNACKTGITVVLGNTAGTAAAVFTVTGTKGVTHTITVPAGQTTTQSYGVAEDTTGAVTVKADGLSKTFTYAKNCAKVLGERQTQHTKHPQVKPTTTKKKPAVQGEKVTQLPFTGFNAGHAMLQAAMLMLLGTVICATAGRRRQTVGRHRS
jgi:uncharacterized repeat protein (TIGR01451 family)